MAPSVDGMVTRIDGSWAHVQAAVMRRSGGQCECTGECGHNHRWVPGVPVQRCRAPHGCHVQRKRDSPSFWLLAGTEEVPLAYPEHYVPKRILIELTVVPIDGNTEHRTEKNIKALCQRCKIQMERLRDQS